jgi:hypothetical protein
MSQNGNGGGREFDLDSLYATAGVFRRAGVAHPILPIDGGTYDFAVHPPDGADPVLHSYEVVARLVPSLAREDVLRLTIPQVRWIVDAALTSIHAVEQAEKNVAAPRGRRPAATAPTAA